MIYATKPMEVVDDISLYGVIILIKFLCWTL